MNLRRFAALGLGLGLFLQGGCSPPPRNDEEARHVGSKVNLSHFKQNTALYKGKAITLELKVEEPIDRSQGRSLQDYVGRDVKFSCIDKDGESVNLVIAIPKGIEVPEVGKADEVLVRFRCKSGSLREGNEAMLVDIP
jgi:hypothetical protein